ncbi:2408_t:CDS:2, partial [Dentiscutata erythropus]
MVKSYLESYFLVGNMNKTDRMTAKDMVEQLQILANKGEIQVEDVPEITKVANWITRYAASLKKHSAEILVEGSNTIRNLNNNFQEMEETEETAKSSNEKGIFVKSTMEPLLNFLYSLENTGNTFYNCFVEPILRLINLPPKDLTFGRESLPLRFYEEILHSEPYVHTE